MEHNHGMSRIPLSPANSLFERHWENAFAASPVKAHQQIISSRRDAPWEHGVQDSPLAAIDPNDRQLSASRIPRAKPDTPRSTGCDLTASKIPRPPAGCGNHSQGSPDVQDNNVQERPTSAGVPDGFHAFTNPSFNLASSSSGSPAFEKQLRVELDPDLGPELGDDDHPATKLLTPEALEILRNINQPVPAAEHQGVRDIMNSYLRTGPQQLSPEPSSANQHTIRAPPPEAVRASGIMNFSAVGGEGVYGAIRGYLRTGAAALSPEPGRADTLGVAVPAPTLAVTHNNGRPQPNNMLPRLPVTRPQSAATPPVSVPRPTTVQPVEPASVCCSNIVGRWKLAEQNSPLPAKDAIAAAVEGDLDTTKEADIVQDAGSAAADDEPAPVEESEEEENKENGDVPAVADNALMPPPPSREIVLAAPVNSGLHHQDLPSASERLEISVGPVVAGAPASDEPVGRTSRRVSPVAFNLPPGSSSEDSPAVAAPPLLNNQLQNVTKNNQDGPDSASGSFSFGMGGAVTEQSEQPTCDPVLGKARPSSGDSVQGPNPFAKMLLHLNGGYASPAQGLLFANAADEDDGSPQSPKECTPLHLLPDAVSPQSQTENQSTPELGQGDLRRWIERRKLSEAINSPALRDLARLWAVAGERSQITEEADTLRFENDALRVELEKVRAALEALGQEHAAAVNEALAGGQRAEMEAARAQEAAAAMKSLAEQIQAAFAACEQENRSLAAELGASRQELAEVEARVTAEEHALMTKLVASRTEAQRAEQEARAAKELAEATAAELEAIRAELAAASSKGDTTPVTKLQSRLADAHRALTALHDGVTGNNTPEIARLLVDSEDQLGAVAELLRNDNLAAARQQNADLRAELDVARSVLAACSPQPTAAPSPQQQPLPVHEGEVHMTVDYKEFQQALGLMDSPADSSGPIEEVQPSPIAAEDSFSIVVEGMVVTNVPPAAVNKVKNMVSFFETLGTEGGSAEAAEQVDEPVDVSATTADTPTPQAQPQVEEPPSPTELVSLSLAPSPSPQWPAVVVASSPQQAVVVESVDNTVNMPSPTVQQPALQSYRVVVTSPSSATRQNLVRSNSLVVTPLSLDAMRGKTGEEMRAEVRARLNKLKADLQSAQNKLKTVDRDLMAFSTPSPQTLTGSTIKREVSTGQAMAIAPTPGKATPYQSDCSEVVQPYYNKAAPSISMETQAPCSSSRSGSNKNDESTENNKMVNTDARSGVLRTGGTATSKSRHSVRFAPSVKGSTDEPDAEEEKEEDRENKRFPVTPAPVLRVAARQTDDASKNNGEQSPQVVVGSTIPASYSHHQAAVADDIAQNQQQSEVYDNSNPDAGATWWLQGQQQEDIDNNAEDNDGVVASAAKSFRGMSIKFDSDSDDEAAAPATDTRSRFAMADFAGVRGMLTPGVSRRTPQPHYARNTPVSRTPMAIPSPGMFSTTSSFNAPEPVALLAIRPIVGRVRRGAGPSSARRPSASEEKEFRRRAAALRIHVSPYFNRKEGGGDDSDN